MSADDSKQKEDKSQKHKHHDKKDMRTIGRWYIGETLGKGGYSWVKKGYDKKTGKCVALKFMAKADESWVAEQSKQVVTEIESLKQIRHANVMKLYAYNLNARYPSTDEKTGDDKTVDTILLVLEYAPGGELFDILYYTSALEEVVARTYFRQVIAGLEACHNVGVVHRDLKPQNLLLDSRFNLKITDFGLSKLLDKDKKGQMKTTYVGTRGYQAPELLLDKAYDLSCDIFSIGVVLFILLTGYPPFEQATDKDRWYKSMTKKNYEVFWKAHRASPLANNKAAKDLLQQMLAYDPKERISIADIKKHEWYNGKFLEGKDLIRALRNRHREMETKRKKDSKKQADLQNSVKPKRDIDFAGGVVPPLVPEEIDENVGLIHTTVDWQEIYNTLDAAIGLAGGVVKYNQTDMSLLCEMNIANQSKMEDINVVEFEVHIFLSRLYNDDKIFNALESIRKDAAKAKQDFFDKNKNDTEKTDKEKDEAFRKEQVQQRSKSKPCYVVKIVRTNGDEMVFTRKVKQQFLLLQCGSLFNGIPKGRAKEDDENAAEQEVVADDDDDDVDYDKFLKDEGFSLDPMSTLNYASASGKGGAAADDVKADA